MRFLSLLLFISLCLAQDCSRVVSLAPSLTDSLLYVGVKPVGVTRFCDYKDAESVGGFIDPNIEKIVSLKPSLVVGLTEQGRVIAQLSNLGIRTESFEHRDLKGISESINRISNRCLNVENHSFKFDHLSKRFSGTAIVVVARDTSEIRNVVLSGSDGFYSELLEKMGVKNLFKDHKTEQVSLEYLRSISPDYVLEISDYDVSAWKELYPNSKVTKVTPSIGGVPGPRIKKLIDVLEQEWG